MEWKTPERLFTCVCKLESEHAKRLAKLYDNGKAMSAEVDAIRRDHLAYTYEIGEKGVIFAGGSLGDFGGTLSIYAVNSEEEAKKAKQNDPYYIKGYLYDDQYAEWFIHQPIAVASAGHKKALEQGLREAGVVINPRKVEAVIPDRLFVCFSKQDPVHAKRLHAIYHGGEGSSSLPDDIRQIRYEHLKYGYEIGEKGIVWAAGPRSNNAGGMSIYAVNSLEEAKEAKEGDPYHKAGLWHGYQYYEWFIHMPYSKLSAGHRDTIKRDLIRYGIIKG